MLIGEMASARAAIGSWRGGSAIRACRVGRSLILANLVDLAVRRFKHHSNLGDFWRLLEPSELISSHGQVGAWGLVDIVAIDTDEFIHVDSHDVYKTLIANLVVAANELAQLEQTPEVTKVATMLKTTHC